MLAILTKKTGQTHIFVQNVKKKKKFLKKLCKMMYIEKWL